jgi:glycosyltransferase involved in cell wall biosynthesis
MNSSVAVIIPAYNSARYLAAAVESALAQTQPPAEIIVVDDGSSDDPEAVVAGYRSVTLLRQANQGVSAARNAGAAAATSDYLVFLDADDRLLPEAVAKNLEQFAARPDCGMVYGSFYNVDAATRQIGEVGFTPPGADAFASFLRGNCIGMLAAAMFRRDRLLEAGGFDPARRACEDYDLFLRTSRRHPVAGRPDVLAEYWHHGANVSRDTALMLRAALDVLRARRDDAETRPEWRAALRDGQANWTRFYADAWTANLRGAGARDMAPLAKQALGIARLAPTALARSLARAVRDRPPTTDGGEVLRRGPASPPRSMP